QFTVTLRLRVTDADGRQGEARRIVYLHHDATLLRGFPLALPGSGEPSPLFASLRRKLRRGGDETAGKQQLLVPTTGGGVVVLGPKGRAPRGWPATTDPLPLHTGSRAFTSGALPVTFYEAISDGLAVGDLDGDGHLEVVAASLAGKVYVWDRRGQR